MTGVAITELLGDRILIITSGYGKSIEEFQVLEVSPSGIYVRLMNENGRKFWRTVVDIALVERLLPATSRERAVNLFVPDATYAGSEVIERLRGVK